MSDEAELELFRQSVSCAALLEQLGDGWRLDQRESTRRALKYRAGPGRIIIINHDGHGWWEATSSAKGDVFSLVQHLQPGLSFGEVRKVLRRFVGIAPRLPAASASGVRHEPDVPPAQRWAGKPTLAPGRKSWSYLHEQRAVPARVLTHAAEQDAVRHGAYDSAWFAHRQDGLVTHVEVRGPTYKGSLRGGTKSLFRFAWEPSRVRLAVLEAPIDALSLAAIEGRRADTVYVATGGGIGPGTTSALSEEIARLAANCGALVIATDANTAGDRFAAQLSQLAEAACLCWERLRPPEGLDWNDVLKRKGRGVP